MAKARKLKDVTIQYVSYVKKGANGKKFFLTKEEDSKEPNVNIDVKSFYFEKNDPKRLIYGVVYAPGEVDSHGDIMDAEDIEKMAHTYAEDYRLIDTNHNYMPGAGSVVETYITPVSFESAKQKIVKGSWILVTKANEENWEAVLDGTFEGYSMAGYAEKIEEVEIAEKSIKSNLLTKVAKAFGLKIDKDFDTELSNAENTDIYRYLRILERVIDDTIWNSGSDTETKKSEILKSLAQLTAKVESMTFERITKSEKGDQMKTKQEILKALMADESLKAEVLAEISKGVEDPKENEAKEEKGIAKEDVSVDDAKNEEKVVEKKEEKESEVVLALAGEIVELKKSIKEISEMLMIPKARTFEKDENPSTQMRFGIKAKTL